MDFDRTLFDTEMLVTDIWKFIESEYGVDIHKEKQRATNFIRHHGDLYDYNFFGQLAEIDEITDSVVEFCQKARAALTKDYLFGDVGAVIDRTDAIITFGNVAYQELKLSMCPLVADVPREIILSSKGPYIKKRYGNVATVLVDDKSIALEIEQPAKFIQIDRQQVDYMTNHGTHWSVNTLDAVPEIVNSLH